MPIRINEFPWKLQSVSYDQAGTIECWMASVNTLLNMMKQKHPFHICQLPSLVEGKSSKCKKIESWMPVDGKLEGPNFPVLVYILGLKPEDMEESSESGQYWIAVLDDAVNTRWIFACHI